MWIWDSEPDESRCCQKLPIQHGSQITQELKMERDQVKGQRRNWLLSQLVWEIYFARRSASENIILHWPHITLKINLKYIFGWKLITWLTITDVILPRTLGENQLAGFLRFLEVCFPSIYVDLRLVFCQLALLIFIKPYTYNYQQDKVDKIVEGMGIHHIIHDLHPPFQCDHLQRQTRETGGVFQSSLLSV